MLRSRVPIVKKSIAADVFAELPSNKGVTLLEFVTATVIRGYEQPQPDERVALMEELPGDLTQRVMNYEALRSASSQEIIRLSGRICWPLNDSKICTC